MKKKISNILVISTVLATFGYIMDGDVKEPAMWMRFAEFFGMIGILFILISSMYFATSCFHKIIKGSRA